MKRFGVALAAPVIAVLLVLGARPAAADHCHGCPPPPGQSTPTPLALPGGNGTPAPTAAPAAGDASPVPTPSASNGPTPTPYSDPVVLQGSGASAPLAGSALTMTPHDDPNAVDFGRMVLTAMIISALLGICSFGLFLKLR